MFVIIMIWQRIERLTSILHFQMSRLLLELIFFYPSLEGFRLWRF
jgi:hypothetical protein